MVAKLLRLSFCAPGGHPRHELDRRRLDGLHATRQLESKGFAPTFAGYNRNVDRLIIEREDQCHAA